MKLVMQNICTPSLVAALLVAVPTTAHAGIKPIHERDEIALTDYKPPSLHTNQGGKSHGGNTTLITPGMFTWKPPAHPSPLPDIESPLSVISLSMYVSNGTGHAYTGNTSISDMDFISSAGFDVIGPTANSAATSSAPVPAPGALTLLLCAGLGSRCRRRRTD